MSYTLACILSAYRTHTVLRSSDLLNTVKLVKSQLRSIDQFKRDYHDIQFAENQKFDKYGKAYASSTDFNKVISYRYIASILGVAYSSDRFAVGLYSRYVDRSEFLRLSAEERFVVAGALYDQVQIQDLVELKRSKLTRLERGMVDSFIVSRSYTYRSDIFQQISTEMKDFDSNPYIVRRLVSGVNIVRFCSYSKGVEDVKKAFRGWQLVKSRIPLYNSIIAEFSPKLKITNESIAEIEANFRANKLM